MRYTIKKAFTLVELLVVITILAIISVVAYQNFWWATDKAVSGRKIQDLSTIEVALQQYNIDKGYFPMPDTYNSGTNMWWYNSWSTASQSNTLQVTYDGDEINTIVSWTGWWKVYALSWATEDWSTRQIWAKWTISRDTVWKRYLSKDLYDPEIGDIKITGSGNTMFDYGLGRYSYAIYAKNRTNSSWSSSKKGSDYNLATTIKKDWSDKYITKIVWNYDEESCFDDSDKCPKTLIGSSTWVLLDKEEENWNTSLSSNQWIPYPVLDFSN